jgi:hypothetical protein
MRRFLCRIGTAAVAVVLLTAEYSVAEIIVTPSGASDALAHRYWYSGYNSYWVDNETNTNLSAYWDTSGYYTTDRFWDIPVLEFPLAGVPAKQATLNFYVSAAGGLSICVRYVGGDNDGTIAASDWLNMGTDVGTFGGTETGWHSFDVTSQLQNAIDAGANWIVFTIRPGEQWASTTISASENSTYSPYLSVVPEPSISVLLGVAAVSFLSHIWRRRRLA